MSTRAVEKSGRAGKGRGVVGFLVVTELASGFLQGWFTPLLEAIGTRWQVDTAQLNWVTAMYMLMTVVFVPVIGKLGDTYGHQRMLAVTAAAVTVGSVVVALAPSYELFLLGRALQAPLAGFLPLEFAIVRERRPEQAGRSIARLIGALTFGAAVGGVLSGTLYGVVGSLAVTLWVPVLFMASCVPIVVYAVPETRRRSAGRVDVTGAVLLGLGLLLLLGALSNGATWGWTDPATLAGLLGGPALLAAWLTTSRRTPHPLVDLSALTAGGIGLPLLAAVCFGAQFYGSSTASSFFYLAGPDTYGYGLGLSASAAGLVLLLPTLVMVAASLAGDRLSRGIGAARTIALGGSLTSLCFLGMVAAGDDPLLFVTANTLGAVGNGLVVAVLPAVVVDRAAPDAVGVSSALYNTSRTAAGAAAGALFALLMSLFATADGHGGSLSTRTSFHAVWLTAAVVSAVVVLLARLIGRRAAEREARQPGAEAPLDEAGVQGA
ncbi:MFS transporter [Streptomyces sp. NPDC090106]|uniref:MFS transporter n=1 Tax=Streptomyces sp. NPDC090106 TaxID=3365946 RepID=UPI0037F53A62